MDGHGAGSDGTGDLEREVERLSGDLLEGRVPSADAPPPATTATPPATPATTPAAPPVDVVFEGLEDVSADLHAIDFLTRPLAPTGPSAAAVSAASTQRALDAVVAGATGTDLAPGTVGPAGNITSDGLQTVAAMTSNTSASLAEPLEQGASFGARHGRNLAVAGVAVVALAAFVGALLALQGGGGEPGSSADLAAVAQASAASPADPSPADPSPVDPSLVAPPDEPTPTPEPTPTLEPTPTPSPTPGNVTIRGPIDASEFSGTATSMSVGTHEALLAFDPKGGPVSGRFTIELKEFPIGLLLTSTFKGEKDPRFAEFKRCTVTLALVAPVKGTFDAATGKLSGTAAFKSATEDVDDCLKTRPSNLSIDPDEVAKPTTVKWRATFNGTRATGSLGLKPAMDFSATTED